MRIGTLIRRWRSFEELTICDVAKELGISAPTLSRIENGEERSGETLAAILRWMLPRDENE
jgi:transcriptional regulator with XRE-family HTH domain